ncbi:TPA: hypothetical protein ACQVH3_005128 [Serratia marcescens]|uniref:hypothetical protein n=1 Tax=Serratia TaxID=613 RepID=UPI0013D963D6|nr:hypothetical protein [Serratia marcescens]MCA3995623.1 hypothetical protein [Serratia marcescens]HBC5220043.1 hypothetical protein [Serratia marcescens]HEJ0402629.1 hypothetical protein [Serratia marcescens]HEJ0405547.1 hypothetical protein [Serratia marcescens]HEJ7314146.1 hypothetical protein [Serratia marcescens]
MDEVVVLERIELIARLGVCYESKPQDKDIALVWISELAGEIKTCANTVSNEIDIERPSA